MSDRDKIRSIISEEFDTFHPTHSVDTMVGGSWPKSSTVTPERKMKWLSMHHIDSYAPIALQVLVILLAIVLIDHLWRRKG